MLTSVPQQKLETAGVINEVISLFSLQPPESAAHNVEVYKQGLRVPVILGPSQPTSSPETVYVYALPWSRGWSVFTTTQEPAGSYSWRDVPNRFKGLQRPLPNPRDRLGPWNTAPSRIAEAVLELVEYLERLNAARRKRFAKKAWYWPTSLSERSADTTNTDAD